MQRAGLKPNDKCVALVLVAYEMENHLTEELYVLVELESNDIMLEREASELLVNWLGRLRIVEEVDVMLRDFISRMTQPIP